MKVLTAVPSALMALALATSPVFAADARMGGTADMPMKDMPMKADMDMHGGMRMGQGMGNHNPDELKWGDAPPSLPKGAQAAMLDGDPHKAGPFVIRLKFPPGYKVPPHWHSKAEYVTVISGNLFLGMGDTMDMKAASMLKQGGFHAIGGQVHHYAFTKGGAVVQIHGEGPFDITYINPADNPDPAAKK